MRQLLICIFALFACVYCANSQVRGNEIRVVVSPDHADWTYDLNEPCSFTIQVYTAQNLLKDVTIDYSLGPEMYPEETKENVLLKEGKLTVKGRMKHPGFYRCKVKAHVNGNTYEGLANAAYRPEQILPTAENPSDFDD